MKNHKGEWELEQRTKCAVDTIASIAVVARAAVAAGGVVAQCFFMTSMKSPGALVDIFRNI
jgi:hypothetical protein